MQAYLDVVKYVLSEGSRKPNRTGVDTLSAFNYNYSISLDDGFPLLTTKEISWKNIVVENLWFLSGAKDIGLLRKHGCKFWDPWADEAGNVPSAYGSFWRAFPGDGDESIDQIGWVLSELQRNPMSRRLVVSAWAPGNAQTSALPPCHAFFVFNVQTSDEGSPTLNLHLTQRSCDVALGLPYNIAGYALILSLMGRFSDIRPGRFGHSIVDAHIYTDKPDGSMAEYDHRPGLEQQLRRTPRALPTLSIDPGIRSLDDVMQLLHEDTDVLLKHFTLQGYDPHPSIKFKVAV